MEWDWYRQEPESEFLYWHWSPGVGLSDPPPLTGFNETMITYLLAIASPTHGVTAPPVLLRLGEPGQQATEYRHGLVRQPDEGGATRNGESYYGVRLGVGVGTGGPLFFTHYSYLGMDPTACTIGYILLLRKQPRHRAHQSRLLHRKSQALHGLRRGRLGTDGERRPARLLAPRPGR